MWILSLLAWSGLCVVSLLFLWVVTVSRYPRDDLHVLTNIVSTWSVVVAAFTSVGETTADFFVGIVDIGRSQGIFFMKLGFVVLVAFAVHEGREQLLVGLTHTWQCLVFPLFDFLLNDVSPIVRLVWSTLTPLYNYAFSIWYQLTIGTLTITAKCGVEPLREGLIEAGRISLTFV